MRGWETIRHESRTLTSLNGEHIKNSKTVFNLNDVFHYPMVPTEKSVS